jgi:predicted permease
MSAPRIWRSLVSWAAPGQDRAAILSDLEEEFESIRDAEGPWRARRWYRGQVLRSAVPLLRLRLRLGASRVAEARREGVVGDLARDLRTGLRVHARAPLVTSVIVVSLALGIGATTSVFSFSRSILFPGHGGVERTEGFVSLYTSDDGGQPFGTTSFPDYLEIQEAVTGLESVAAVRLGVVEAVQDDEPRRLIAELVTGEYFPLLGVSLPLGRAFAEEETRFGDAHRVVVLGHHVWTGRYAADPGILGREVILDGEPFVVVGVAPESLRSRFLQLRVDAWIPLGIPGGTYHATESELTNRRDREYIVVGRSAPGISGEQLQAQLDGLAGRLRTAYPAAWTDDRAEPRRLTFLTEAESRVPPPFRAVMGGFSLLLLAGTGLVLLVACSNVAGLLLARAHARTREMAIRVSLGASRGRIIRMLLAEGLLLAVAGGGLGVLGAIWAAGRLSNIPLPGDLPTLSLAMAVDWPVLVFAALVATGASILFGVAPALEAARADAMRPGTGSLRTTTRRSGLRRGLVAIQVAGSVVFLAGAALVLRSIESMDATGSGISTESLAVVTREIPEELSGQDPIAYFGGLADAALADERVDRVALASAVEGTPFFDLTRARIRVQGQDDVREVVYNAVSPGYTELVGLQVVAGRGLDATDVRGASRVVVVNESFARRFWPDRPAVGRQFTMVERRHLSTPEDTVPVTVEVVGVVRNVRNTAESEGVPFLWAPMDQFPVRMAVLAASGPSGPGAAALALRQRLPAAPGQVSLVGPSPHLEVAALGTLGSRLALRGLGFAAAFVLGLALVGLAGMVSFTVNLRLPEMALRKALGADPGTVVGEVVRGALSPVWKGTLLGLVVVIPLAYLARSVLYGVSPVDPMALGGSLVLLALCATGTSLVPAIRAGRADPNRYLKGD